MSFHLDAHGNVEPEFARTIGALAEAFGQTVTAMRIKLYARALEDVPLVAVKAACAQAVREARFFPAVAELRHYLSASPDERALLAWGAFAQAAADVGSYRPLLVEDGAAAEALVATFGSWPDYCALTEIAVASRKAEFLAAYREAIRNGRPAVARTLAGALGTTDAPGLLTAGGHVKALPERT